MEAASRALADRSKHSSLAARVDVLMGVADPKEQAVSLRHLKTVLSVATVFSLSTCLLLTCWVLIPVLAFGWRASAIESGSMQPAIERGDVVVFKKPDKPPLSEGAVIRFADTDPSRTGTLVHRIESIDFKARRYVTRGDANPTSDSTEVPYAGVQGVGTLVVPLVGRPLLWAREGMYLPLAILLVGVVFLLGPGLAATRELSDHGTDGPSYGPLTPSTTRTDSAETARPLIDGLGWAAGGSGA